MSEDGAWHERLQEAVQAERSGRWDDAESRCACLWDEALAAGRPDVAFEGALIAARVRGNLGELPAAAQWLKRMLAEPQGAAVPACVAEAWVMLAGVQASLGDGEGAAHAIARTTECLAATTLDVERRQRAYNALSLAYYQLGFTPHAVQMLRESMDLAPPPAGEPAGLLRRLNLAMMMMEMHDAAAYLPEGLHSLSWLDQAEQQLDEVEPHLAAMSPWQRLMDETLRAGFQRRRGAAGEAARRLREALRDPPPAPPSLMRFARQELAQALATQGPTVEEARAMAESLLREAREDSGATTSMWQLENIALMAQVAGRHDEAFQALARSLALLRRHATVMLESDAVGLSRSVDASTQRLFNVDLEARNRELTRTVQEANRAALFDALTGVLNRRGLQAQFERLRGHRAFALALIDVDHFKRINDCHSHLVGDAVLRRLGALLQEQLRGPDVVGRWGGEEFMLLLDEAEPARSLGIAERLRQRIASEPWTDLAHGLSVTVSLGLARVDPREPLEAAVGRADVQLYRAKHEGRNRVCGPVH